MTIFTATFPFLVMAFTLLLPVSAKAASVNEDTTTQQAPRILSVSVSATFASSKSTLSTSDCSKVQFCLINSFSSSAHHYQDRYYEIQQSTVNVDGTHIKTEIRRNKGVSQKQPPHTRRHHRQKPPSRHQQRLRQRQLSVEDYTERTLNFSTIILQHHLHDDEEQEDPGASWAQRKHEQPGKDCMVCPFFGVAESGSGVRNQKEEPRLGEDEQDDVAIVLANLAQDHSAWEDEFCDCLGGHALRKTGCAIEITSAIAMGGY